MFVHLNLYAGVQTWIFCILLYANIIQEQHVRSPLSSTEMCARDKRNATHGAAERFKPKEPQNGSGTRIW